MPGDGEMVVGTSGQQDFLLVDVVFSMTKVFRQGAKPRDDISLLGIEYTGSKLEHYSI